MSGNVAAVVLVDRREIRYRPDGAGTAERLPSRSLLPVAGRPIVHWLLPELCRLGVHEVHLSAADQHVLARLEAGLGDLRRAGVRVDAAAVPVGSAGPAGRLLQSLQRWRLSGTVLITPGDALLRFDLGALVRAHDEPCRTLTMAAVRRPLSHIAGRHTVLQQDGGRVHGLLHRPSYAALRDAAEAGGHAGPGPEPELLISTRAGLVEAGELRQLAATHPPRPARDARYWDADVARWLLAYHRPVGAVQITAAGLTDTPRDYLETTECTLRGGLCTVHPAGLDGYVELEGRRWVHETALRRRDPVTGRTLAEKLAHGSVVIGAHVRLGRDVQVGPGVRLSDADIGDGVVLGEDATVQRTVLGRDTMVEPHAVLRDCCVGARVEIRSSRHRPTRITDYAVIADEVCLHEGVRLQTVSVYPGLTVPADLYLPEGLEVTSAAVLRRLAAPTQDLPWPV